MHEGGAVVVGEFVELGEAFAEQVGGAADLIGERNAPTDLPSWSIR